MLKTLSVLIISIFFLQGCEWWKGSDSDTNEQTGRTENAVDQQNSSNQTSPASAVNKQPEKSESAVEEMKPISQIPLSSGKDKQPERDDGISSLAQKSPVPDRDDQDEKTASTVVKENPISHNTPVSDTDKQAKKPVVMIIKIPSPQSPVVSYEQDMSLLAGHAFSGNVNAVKKLIKNLR